MFSVPNPSMLRFTAAFSTEATLLSQQTTPAVIKLEKGKPAAALPRKHNLLETSLNQRWFPLRTETP